MWLIHAGQGRAGCCTHLIEHLIYRLKFISGCGVDMEMCVVVAYRNVDVTVDIVYNAASLCAVDVERLRTFAKMSEIEKEVE